MRVLKEGNPQKLKETLRFDCKSCGCSFEANKGEYKPADCFQAVHDGLKASCKCPCCGKTVWLDN